MRHMRAKHTLQRGLCMTQDTCPTLNRNPWQNIASVSNSFCRGRGRTGAGVGPTNITDGPQHTHINENSAFVARPNGTARGFRIRRAVNQL